MKEIRSGLGSLALILASSVLLADYANFESAHVHPIALTSDGARLVALNTPDAVLEVFLVDGTGGLTHERSIPVGLEPVSLALRNDAEAWVVNRMSDTVNVVDLVAGRVVRTLDAGDEPADVAFAGGRAFVAVSGDDTIRVFELAQLDAAPTVVPVFGDAPRALAVSPAGDRVYAVVLRSGNRTSVVNANVIFGNNAGLDGNRLSALGLADLRCDGAPPAYPPLPPGITRNPALTDPAVGTPQVGLIVRWNEAAGRWEDEVGADWSHCLPFRLPDHDLFVIDATTLTVATVDHLGTSLFDVAVHPGNGKIYVPNTEARNFVRFEHPLGVRGHVVDNRLSVIDPADSWSVRVLDLNTHVNRASDPATNLAERAASISQPGMLVWRSNGAEAFLAAIGSRRVFAVDGACLEGDCVFGPARGAPRAVEVGEGPTGIALLEEAERLYVLNRFSNSIAVVDAATLTKLDEVPLHDPSPQTVLEGRRFLYDAILGSGHGDAACSSCHLFGDRDGQAWDLGDPTGEMVPYATPNDNVRFVVPFQGQPTECAPELCAAHDGFDPQKGPMTTQTLRGMLEPLHWRGDRATMNDFNGAFVTLMGTADSGPPAGGPAGLSAADMERFRQFALGLRFPPNPFRQLDDTLPNATVPIADHPFAGNPAAGATIFDTFPADAGQPCAACHTHPFGAAGGKLGGVTPTEPTSPDAAALFNGRADQSIHNDLKIAHLRNMYEKAGPLFGREGATPDAKTGFGFAHDGTVPDLGTFFSLRVFTLSPQQVRDVVAFMTHFPTETRPAVGKQLLLPAGAAPTGTVAEEGLLATLLALGDRNDAGRHCELTVALTQAGRDRRFHLSGGAWVADTASEPTRTTAALRATAESSLHFLCAPLESGLRLGGDRDEDGVRDGDDCAAADSSTWSPADPVTTLTIQATGEAASLAWSGPSVSPGPSLRYEILAGDLAGLRLPDPAAGCLAADLVLPAYADTRADPPAGAGYWYLVRSGNPCGTAALGAGREAWDALTCAEE